MGIPCARTPNQGPFHVLTHAPLGMGSISFSSPKITRTAIIQPWTRNKLSMSKFTVAAFGHGPGLFQQMAGDPRSIVKMAGMGLWLAVW